VTQVAMNSDVRTSQTIRLGTRGSALALTQSRWVAERLQALHPELTVDLIGIKTTGDKIVDVPLSQIGGKALFTKEIETALLEHHVDIAVHSMKDLPTELPKGLCVGAVPQREDPHDLLIPSPGLSNAIDRERPLNSLARGSLVGTSSLRRKAQLLHHRPDLRVEDLRGNVDTRLRKLRAGDYDAIILAAAGLSRMGWLEVPDCSLPYACFLPAPGQGALAIECRKSDEKTTTLLKALDHPQTHLAVRAERQLLLCLEGGCQIPIAALAQCVDGLLSMEALVSSLDGREVIRDSLVGDDRDQPERLGDALAGRLLSSGAGAILEAIKSQITLPG